MKAMENGLETEAVLWRAREEREGVMGERKRKRGKRENVHCSLIGPSG